MRKILGFWGLLIGFSAFGQIVDDTTKLVYSANSTKVIYERDVKNSLEIERHPDTLLYNLENFTVLDRKKRTFQDLGNNGTAMFPIFYPIANQIGKTSGFSAYDPYVYTPDLIRYFDTKSPFMDLEVVFGGDGRSTVDFTFARNIKPTWNFGFDIHRIVSDKQIGLTGLGDRNVENNTFYLFTDYQHATLRYRLLFNVMNLNITTEETGGILLPDDPNQSDFFQYQDSNIRLSGARGVEHRLNWHLYHQYAFRDQLQFYHQLDIKKQDVKYSDEGTVKTGTAYNSFADFYPAFLLSTTETRDRALFTETVNEAGIKGNLAALFYRAYVKRRDYDFSYLYLDPTAKAYENFIGGYTRFVWKDKFDIEGEAEYLQTGQYKLIGRLNSDLIFGSYSSVSAKPAFIYEQCFGNHHEWSQSLNQTFTNEIKGGIQLKTDYFKLRPTIRLMTLNNFLYFDQDQMARQSASVGLISSLGGNFDLTLYTDKALGKAFHFENEVYLTTLSGNGKDNLRMPPVFYNGKAFWRGLWFKNTMAVELGVDIHAKTNYYAMAYMPELQQFYLQDDFKIDSFFTTDFFLNMKVLNVRAFLKMVNLNQQANDGYFVTPYYPGKGRVFDFGVTWQFYD